MVNVNFNTEKNGIEVSFDCKPDTSVLSALKENGFRWSGKQKFWYAKNTEERVDALDKLLSNQEVNNNIPSLVSEKPMQKICEYDLFDMTRTDGIEDNFKKYHIYSTKEIAAIIRKHVRSRFPMCKWTVTSDRNSISLHILSGPFDKDSEELNAIAHYAYVFAQSYNYDNSDSVTDYFDVNFYGVYERQIVSYSYEKREATVAEANMSVEFNRKLEAFKEAERIREEKELEESLARREAEAAEAKKIQEQRDKNREMIEQSAEIKEVDYYVLNCSAPDTSKADKLSSYEQDGVEMHSENCHVSREVHLAPEVYDVFVNQLLSDYSFLYNMGGTATDDLRITSMIDYRMMEADERREVEFYNNNCVAIFCGCSMKLIINPEGYSYARYVLFVTHESNLFVKDFKTSLGISVDEYAQNKVDADEVKKTCEDIIKYHNLTDTWNTSDLPAFKNELMCCMDDFSIRFNTPIIRAINDADDDELKRVLYLVNEEYNGIQRQFDRAKFADGERITVVQISEFGGCVVTHGRFVSYEKVKYAQYDKAVKMVYIPKNSYTYRATVFFRPVLIYRGWMDVPDSVLWDMIDEGNGVVIRKTKFLSCDRQQYLAVYNYLKENGFEPTVNTYRK